MTYLPSTEFVRGVYATNEMATVPEHAGQDLRVRAWGRGVAEFQRWLNDHEAKIRANALRDAARFWDTETGLWQPNAVSEVLRNHAAGIIREESRS